MHQSIATINSPEFINLQPLEINPLMSKCEIKVLYLGENRNRSFISKEVAVEMSKTLRGAPIVGYYNENKEDFVDHGEQVIIDGDGVKFRNLTKPYGFVSLDSKIWFQDFEDKDEFGNSIVRTYLMCEGYLWTEQYAEAKKVLEEGRPQSMELQEKTLEGHWAENSKSGISFFIINDAIFSKLCILGEEVEPCFEGASIKAPEVVNSSFSLDNNFKHSLFTMLKELKEFTLSSKIDEGGNSMTGKENEVQVVEPEVASTESATEFAATETPAATPAAAETPAAAVTEVEFKKTEEPEKKDDEDPEKDDDDSKDGAKKDDNEDDDNDDKKKYSLHTDAEYEQLAVEFTKLQNKYALLEQEVKSLTDFKNSIEDQKKTDLINSFYMLSDEDKADIVANKSKYTLDEIEAKLSVLYVKKNVNFNEAEVEKEEKPAVTFNLQSAEIDNLPAWLRAVEENKNRK